MIAPAVHTRSQRRAWSRWLALFAALCLTDCTLTAWALAHGATELNPLFAALFAGAGVPLAIAFNLTIRALGVLGVAILSRAYPRIAALALAASLALLVVVLAHDVQSCAAIIALSSLPPHA